jgi:hypothetical protein
MSKGIGKGSSYNRLEKQLVFGRMYLVPFFGFGEIVSTLLNRCLPRCFNRSRAAFAVTCFLSVKIKTDFFEV